MKRHGERSCVGPCDGPPRLEQISQDGTVMNLPFPRVSNKRLAAAICTFFRKICSRKKLC